MADTRRSLAELQALFGDNTTGDISPQDLRDFLYTASPPHGTIYISSATATTISQINTWYKAAGTTTSTNLKDFDMPVAGRLRYTGTPTVHVHVAVSVSMSSAANNVVTGLRMVKNDSPTDTDSVASTVIRKIASQGDIGSTAVHFDTMLDSGDYIELWIQNQTGVTDLTINNLYLFALGMLM